jgi:glycosyltransferase involved in cell wall biosynthesis
VATVWSYSDFKIKLEIVDRGFIRNSNSHQLERDGAGLISIIIPACNEKNTIEELIERVERVAIRKEIIVVDDGSTDGTREIIARLGAAGRVIPIISERNQGKGKAVRLGLERARGEVSIIQDADFEYDPSEIPNVVGPILSGTADVCYGSRILGDNAGRSSFWFYWGGRLVSWVTTLLYGIHVTDEATCYKAFRTELLRRIPLRSSGFELEPEITAKVFREGLRFCEVPISYHPRSITEGKKIRLKDGLRAIWTLIFWRFAPY